MSKCMDCRFTTMKGCRAGVCQEVRADMRGQGVVGTFRPLVQLRPEPIAPGGVTGHQIEYAGRRLEWPPTVEGRNKAWDMVTYLATIGVDAKYTELRRDFEIPQRLRSAAR